MVVCLETWALLWFPCKINEIPDCNRWRRRCGQEQFDPAVLPGNLHLHLQKDNRSGLPGEGGDGRQWEAGATDAVGHRRPGGV